MDIKRVLVILQLCFVFSTICWTLGYPYMGELYELRNRMFIARTVTGDSDLLQYVSRDRKERDEKTLQKNRNQFQQLPEKKQREIMEDMGLIQAKMEESVGTKLKKGVRLLFFELPIIKRAWLFMALAISLGILFGLEGAVSAAWVLPLLSIAYLFFAEPKPNDPVAALYPQSEELPAGSSFEKQWERYIEKNWETPFQFNIALLDAYKSRPSTSNDQPLIFFAWNLFFAYYVGYVKKTRHTSMDSSCHTA